MLASMTHIQKGAPWYTTATAKSLKEVARTLGDMFLHVGISMVYLPHKRQNLIYKICNFSQFNQLEHSKI
jgi:hypothetical protein